MAKVKDSLEKTEEMTRKIWLAGLGAFGQGLENLHEGYARMSDERRKRFEQLVERGSRLEDEALSTLRSAGESLKSKGDKLRGKISEEEAALADEGASLKKRLNELRSSLSNRLGQVGEKLVIPNINSPELLSKERARDLNKVIDEINKAIARVTLGGETKAAKPKKPTAQRSGTRSTATGKAPVKTRKTAAASPSPAAKTTKVATRKTTTGTRTAASKSTATRKSTVAKPTTATKAVRKPATRKAPTAATTAAPKSAPTNTAVVQDTPVKAEVATTMES